MATGDFITANNFISGNGFSGALAYNGTTEGERFLTGHQLVVSGYMTTQYWDPCGGTSTSAGGTLYIYQWNGTAWVLIYTHSNATTNSFTLTFNRNGVNASYFPQWRILTYHSNPAFNVTTFYSNNTHCKGGNNTAGKRIYYCYNDHNSQTPNWGFQIGTPITWDYAKNLTDGYNSP